MYRNDFKRTLARHFLECYIGLSGLLQHKQATMVLYSRMRNDDVSIRKHRLIARSKNHEKQLIPRSPPPIPPIRLR